MGSSPHHSAPGRVKPVAHDSDRGAPAGVDAGACPPVQPLRTTSAHADLGVVPEPDEVLLGERRPAAPASGILHLFMLDRRDRHRSILQSGGPRHQRRAKVERLAGVADPGKLALHLDTLRTPRPTVPA